MVSVPQSSQQARGRSENPDLRKIRPASRIATPRWGWSGAAPHVSPVEHEQRLSSIVVDLLPRRQSPVYSLVGELLALGARYARYLHQDEFGPTRAEQIAALRQILDHLALLCCNLRCLPTRLRVALGSRLAQDERWCQENPNFGTTFSADSVPLDTLYEAAVDIGDWLVRAQAIRDAKLMESLSEIANRTWGLLGSADTTTALKVVLDADLRSTAVAADEMPGSEPLTVLCSQIDGLRRRFDGTLARLRSASGPEPRVSLPWLVWQLCDLWHRETGEVVTSSAVRKGKYTSKPQSLAGKFVLAAVEALQPSEAWLLEHGAEQAPIRARAIVGPVNLYRAVHLSMRQYVTHHPTAHRRGRPRAERPTS